MVDGFRFQDPSRCQHYFLTHAHSDHTTGLTRTFSSGFIYCTEITYRLLVGEMGVAPQFLRSLALDQEVVIDGIPVTPISANHCPGACMFKFIVPKRMSDPKENLVVLHTGDFRWCSETYFNHPALSNGCDILMLDTTYCAPRWKFPTQSETIQMMIKAAEAEVAMEPDTLFVCMSYHIGKEKAYFNLAIAMGWKVWCTKAKRRTLQFLDLPTEWMNTLTDIKEEAQLHVLSMGAQMHTQALADSIRSSSWKRIVLLKPTGWSFAPTRKGLQVQDEGVVRTIGIPYSEHSSFPELLDCVKTLRPKQIIPTVNSSESKKSKSMVDLLSSGMDLSEDKGRIPAYFLSPPMKRQHKNEEEFVDLDGINIEQQAKLLLSFQEKKTNRSRENRAPMKKSRIWQYFKDRQ